MIENYIRENKDKRDFANNFNQIIHNQKDKYNVIFMTYTFNDMKTTYKHEDYEKVFQKIYYKYDNVISLNSSENKKAPMLFLIPEEPLAQHYHGFLFVHKERMQRFQRKTFESVYFNYNEKIKDCEIRIDFHRKFIDPNYNKKNKLDFPKTRPQLQSLYAALLCSDCDYDRCVNYCFKKYTKSTFTSDDFIIIVKEKN